MRLVDADELLKQPLDQANYPSNYVKSAPTIEAIPIPKDATNGDVIKALFNPKFVAPCKDDYGDETGDIYVELDGGIIFTEEWWNAHYKEQSDESTNQLNTRRI